MMDGRVLSGTAGEQWKYYDSGELDSSKIGQLMVHGVIVTELDGRKDAENSYLIDKNGYLLKKTMKKATDGKYYLTDKNGCIYKNRIVTYKKKQYYVTETGARATWKRYGIAVLGLETECTILVLLLAGS